ncbi:MULTISPECIES: hypothetical protein [Bacilli]|jgi:hypothetical protein|uniref:hypothetical protein n=1 Tax=Bacilli TaxID=91061 RepID=UPI00242D4FFE|nr:MULTISPECIES: hypothetical protein [Bacilli]MCI1764392.1 hypothetical protein [Heyndrickxia oleronia]MEC5141450.1 hypothetical protein [Pediococcus pentosaceus]
MSIITNVDPDEALKLATALNSKLLEKDPNQNIENTLKDYSDIDEFYDELRILGVFVNEQHGFLKDDIYVITNAYIVSGYYGGVQSTFEFGESDIIRSEETSKGICIRISQSDNELKMYTNTQQDSDFMTNQIIPLLTTCIDKAKVLQKGLAERKNLEHEAKVKTLTGTSNEEESQLQQGKQPDQSTLTKIMFSADNTVISANPIPVGYEYIGFLHKENNLMGYNLISGLGNVEKATDQILQTFTDSLAPRQAIFNLKINIQYVPDAPGVIVQVYGDLCNRLI